MSRIQKIATAIIVGHAALLILLLIRDYAWDERTALFSFMALALPCASLWVALNPMPNWRKVAIYAGGATLYAVLCNIIYAYGVDMAVKKFGCCRYYSELKAIAVAFTALSLPAGLAIGLTHNWLRRRINCPEP